MTTAWLDVMPEIPLARGAPVMNIVVRGLPDGYDGRGIVVDPCDGILTLTYGRRFVTSSRAVRECSAADLRVDLDDPQGFAYVLRWYVARADLRTIHSQLQQGRETPTLRDELLARWLCGETTDADKLALARACAEAAKGAIDRGDWCTFLDAPMKGGG